MEKGVVGARRLVAGPLRGGIAGPSASCSTRVQVPSPEGKGWGGAVGDAAEADDGGGRQRSMRRIGVSRGFGRGPAGQAFPPAVRRESLTCKWIGNRCQEVVSRPASGAAGGETAANRPRRATPHEGRP